MFTVYYAITPKTNSSPLNKTLEYIIRTEMNLSVKPGDCHRYQFKRISIFRLASLCSQETKDCIILLLLNHR